MKKLNKTFLKQSITTVIINFNAATTGTSIVRSTLQEIAARDLYTNSTGNFAATLQFCNDVMNQFLDNAAIQADKDEVTLTSNYRAAILSKAYPDVTKFKAMLISQINSHVNKLSKLDNSKWKLIPVLSTKKTTEETAFPWAGSFRLVQKANKARTVEHATDSPAETVTKKMEAPSVQSIVETVAGKNANQQLAMFKKLRGDITVSPQQVIDAIFGIAVYTVSASAKTAKAA